MVELNCFVWTDHGVSGEQVAEAYHAFEHGSQVSPLTAAAVSNQSIQESMRLLLITRAYQVRNFLAAFELRPSQRSQIPDTLALAGVRRSMAISWQSWTLWAWTTALSMLSWTPLCMASRSLTSIASEYIFFM